jgi:acyl dehydratase
VETPLIATRTISAEDIATCARLTGDFGSHHVSGITGRQMAQGLLTLATAPLFDRDGVHVAEMSVRFHTPVFAEDTITAVVGITDRAESSDGQVQLTCSLSVTNDDGIQVMTGTGVVRLQAELAGSLAGGIGQRAGDR